MGHLISAGVDYKGHFSRVSCLCAKAGRPGNRPSKLSLISMRNIHVINKALGWRPFALRVTDLTMIYVTGDALELKEKGNTLSGKQRN